MDTAEARDIISQQILAAWNLYSNLSLLEANLFFPDRVQDGPPTTNSQTWARVQIVHSAAGQSSLPGGQGKKRFTREATITLQLFTPFNDGLAENDILSQYFVDIFQGNVFGKIWLRDAYSKEIGNAGNWFQTNVLVDAEYDQIK